MVGFYGIDFISVNNADRRILIGEIIEICLLLLPYLKATKMCK